MLDEAGSSNPCVTSSTMSNSHAIKTLASPSQIFPGDFECLSALAMTVAWSEDGSIARDPATSDTIARVAPTVKFVSDGHVGAVIKLGLK